MDDILLETEEKMKLAIESMEKRFLNVRAGRANPAILNGIVVPYYGVGTIGAIEKAIFEANIGLTPNNNGEVIILNIPALTEDTRRDYVKQVKGMAEDAKIALRNIRQDANNAIKKLEVSEDDIKSGQDEVQKLIQEYNSVVEEKLKVKENELMTV